jgi:DNA ligase D-like protein (predicted ligase)
MGVRRHQPLSAISNKACGTFPTRQRLPTPFRASPPLTRLQAAAHCPIVPKQPPKSSNLAFIETMDCLGVKVLPEGPEWSYEIKLDGYRVEAIHSSKGTALYSRRRNPLTVKFPYIAAALAKLPAATILDGELVAMGADNRSDFNLLQNFRSAESQIKYYAFDLLALKGKSLLNQPLEARRRLLADVLVPNEHVALSVVSPSVRRMLKFVEEHNLEGLVAKRIDSGYEPGLRSGLWQKHRVNEGQEFVIGGFTPGTHGFDALIVGVYIGKDLHFAARVRAGFVPATRREVFAQIRHLKTARCPFVNLPEKSEGRWGQGLTAEKMKDCIWLRPEAVVRIEFAQWTGAGKLRHTKFVAVRTDKDPRKVVREQN